MANSFALLYVLILFMPSNMKNRNAAVGALCNLLIFFLVRGTAMENTRLLVLAMALLGIVMTPALRNSSGASLRFVTFLTVIILEQSGGILNSLFLLVIGVLLLVDVAVDVEESLRVNKCLGQLEERLVQVNEMVEQNTSSFLSSAGWFVASLATGGVSKFVQIPRNIVRNDQRRQWMKMLRFLQFQLSDIYYCRGNRKGFGGLHSSEFLLSSEEWQEMRARISPSAIEMLKEACHWGGIVNDVFDLRTLVSENIFEVPFDAMSAIGLGDLIDIVF